MDRLIGPGGEKLGPPSIVKLQAEAVRQELAFGRMALRVLGVLLVGMRDRQAFIGERRWRRFQEKYPGASVRFAETAEGLTVRLTLAEPKQEERNGGKRA